LKKTCTLVVLILCGLTGAPAAQNGSLDAERPPWAVAGVPDNVWMLVGAAEASNKKDQAKDLLKEAEDHARIAVADNEDHVGSRYALTIVLGLRTEREGGKTKIGLATEMRSQLEAILQREPTHAGAHHLFGRLNAAVLRMGGFTRWIAGTLLGGGELKKATWAEAEGHLVFAEDRAPGVSDHHLQLGYLYRDTKRPTLALAEVEHVLAMPVQSAKEQRVHDEAVQLKKKLVR
jgi:hypothetical protein